ncbi:S-formylglutathione hydrolase [soil metagenome]
MEEKSRAKSFGGTTRVYSHRSEACDCEMSFAVYVPPQAENGPVSVLYYLSGLTCNEKNFIEKAGAQRYAAEHGLMLVAPDTSPRGVNIPGEGDDWDFGTGAGFYVNATESPWAKHYQMYDYVTEELPGLIAQQFSVKGDRAGIFGHSMGGHGALICGLKNPDKYASISAFAPIAAPSQCAWGQKALTGYLGTDKAAWEAYDATELVAAQGSQHSILIDQGEDDSFLAQGQLLPEVFAAACTQAKQPLTLRRQPGYDHSYYFIATFMGDHIRHHAAALTS